METSNSTKDAWKSWEKTHTDQMVASINTVRGQRGLTVKDLAKRLDFYGWPVGVATLNGILSGQKRASLSVAELIVFARALYVPPNYFILGMPLTEELPGAPVFAEGASVVDVMDWMMAAMPVPPLFPGDDLGRDSKSTEYRVFRDVTSATTSLTYYAHAMRSLKWQNSLQSEMRRYDASELERALPKTVFSGTVFRRAQHGIQVIRAEQRKGGFPELALPPLPSALAFLDTDMDVNDMPAPIPGFSEAEDLEDARNYLERQIRDYREGGGPNGTPA